MITDRHRCPAGFIFLITIPHPIVIYIRGWAQIIDLNFSFYPFDKDFYGSLTTLRTAFYLPGFFPE